MTSLEQLWTQPRACAPHKNCLHDAPVCGADKTWTNTWKKGWTLGWILLCAVAWLSPHYSEASTPQETVLVLGDSISAGYGIEPGESWVDKLSEALQAEEKTLVNASISGETTAGGLARLPALLQAYSPRLLVLELGGNDGLRGYQPKVIRNHLEQMIQLAQARDCDVYLLGMRIPPNYGRRYTELFAENYKQLAHEYLLAFAPFFLHDVGGHDNMMQADGIHPNTAAQAILLRNVLRHWPEEHGLKNEDSP